MAGVILAKVWSLAMFVAGMSQLHASFNHQMTQRCCAALLLLLSTLLQVPLLLTVYVLVSFKAFHPLPPGSATPPPSPDFFEVPGSYKRRLLSEVMDKAAANMMGMGPGRGSSRGGSSGGGSCFYGGDEGEDGMMLADDEDWLGARDEELQREFERLREEREGNGGSSGGGSSSSSSKGGWRRRPKGRAGRIGSGLDADMRQSSKW
jgi:hypothetical protein